MLAPPTAAAIRLLSCAAMTVGMLVVSAFAVAVTRHGTAPGNGQPFVTWNAHTVPAPLTVAEESDPFTARLARRFSPAMALPDATGPWPVAVSYTWSRGAPLMSRTIDRSGSLVGEAVARPATSLGSTSWAELPVEDAQGRSIHYWIDAPGDDNIGEQPQAQDRRGDDGASPGQRLTAWRQRWREIAGDDPARSPYPPTQYAHLFWVDRAGGMLAIQYWFFFPFNEWINHHEGDWEHVNVILRGPSKLGGDTSLGAFEAVGYQFFFHGLRVDRTPGGVSRIAHGSGSGLDDDTDTDTDDANAGPAAVSRQGGDHVVVFTGGRGQFLAWGGTFSGGSYPSAARFTRASAGIGPLRASDDTRHPQRFLAPEAFRIVLLPEPGRLDTAAHPELSWLRLPFFVGQPRMQTNPPLARLFGCGAPPAQPAMRGDWNAAGQAQLWTGTEIPDERPVSQILPRTWTPMLTPGPLVAVRPTPDIQQPSSP